MNKDRPFVVAAIPAYDEEKTITRVVLQAQRYVDKAVACDDGSTDMTTEIAEKLYNSGKVVGYGCACMWR